MKNTIRNTVNEVYNTNVNNIKSDPLLSVDQFITNVSKIKNTDIKNLRLNTPLRQTNNNYFLLFLLIFLLISFFGIALYFRDKIKSYLDKFFDSQPQKESKKDNEKKDKVKPPEEKEEKPSIEEKKIKENKKTQTNQNINKIKYPKDQIVKQDDMYCYLGEDDNMRQCIEVFKDDVCTSGDIFNRIDQCLVPNKKNV